MGDTKHRQPALLQACSDTPIAPADESNATLGSAKANDITTIEGLAQGDELHPVQATFIKHDGFQCGYCTPGQICSAVAMLKEAEAGAASQLTLAIHHKQLEFRCVLMDTWYASRQFMLHIERNGKIYYCPLQDNRQVDEGDGTVIKYQRVDSLEWSGEEKAHGKNLHARRLSQRASPPTVPARGLY